MAKVVITIEDRWDGEGFGLVVTPSVETLTKAVHEGRQITNAEGLALSVCLKIFQESKKVKPSPILIPRVHR